MKEVLSAKPLKKRKKAIAEAENKKGKWNSFFSDKTVVPDDFLADRGDAPPQKRDLF
jgi:hypothetical protein